MSTPGQTEIIDVSSTFKLILFTVIAITAVAFVANVMLVLMADTETDEQVRNLVSACSDTWKGGFAAILGLLAGKAT